MGRSTIGSRCAAAVLVPALALVAAAGGTAMAGDPGATPSALSKKKVKKLVKREVRKQLADAVGPQGPPGPPGRDAASLFAYVRDPVVGGAPSIEYGRGATGLSELPAPPDGRYLVTFNRSVRNCVAQANLGFGNPAGNSTSLSTGVAFLRVNEGASNQVQVEISHGAADWAPEDASFMISVFC
jgi:hypothetical protein